VQSCPFTGTMGSKHDTSSETLSIVSVSSGTASASRSLLSYQFPGYASTTDRTAALLQHRLLNQLWTGRWRCASAIVPFHAPLETLPNTSHGERAAPSTKSCNAGCACGCLPRPATVRPRLAAKVSIDQDVIGPQRCVSVPALDCQALRLTSAVQRRLSIEWLVHACSDTRHAKLG
jgi:hypothetical protein